MRKIISLIAITTAIMLYAFLNKEDKLIDTYNNWVNDTTEVGVFPEQICTCIP